MPLNPIPLDQLEKVGLGVQRPEDVVVGRDGRVWLSDQQSAAAEARPDGSLNRVGDAGGSPNGINMDAEQRIIIANVGGLDGGDSGPVQRLDTETGEIEILAAEVAGMKLLASNYPHIDSRGRIWVTHSTFRSGPAAFDGEPDGFLFRIEEDGGTTLLADKIEFANGITLDPEERNAYVCQTSGCNVIRFPINDDGSLGRREQYGPLLGKTAAEMRRTAGDRPLTPQERNQMGLTDGCQFDQEGNLWVTLPMSNKVVAITPGGEAVTIINDPEGALMQAPTNVTWGGNDLQDLYIGSIRTNYVLKTRVSTPGEPLIHQK